MPSIDWLEQSAARYHQAFQELTARIYADGFVSCEEATEETRYYQQVRPRLRRILRQIRRQSIALHNQYTAQMIKLPAAEQRLQRQREGNARLKAYYGQLEEFDRLLNDTTVMLKIFADVLHDCGEGQGSAED